MWIHKEGKQGISESLNERESMCVLTSGQDGRVGKHCLPPPTTMSK